MSRDTSDRWWGTGSLRSVFLRIVGMPDYKAYVSNLREAHPDDPVPSESEFFDEYVRHRYERGPGRCC